MSHQVTLKPSNKTISTVEHETVLSASLRNGVPYPYSCQSGKCGACKSRLISGEIEHLSHNKFTLTEAEKENGVFLSCRAVAKTDIEISWFGNAMTQLSPIKTKSHIVSKEMLTHDTYRIVLESNDGHVFNFKPGQYALLTLPHLPSRSYSMANQPGSQFLEFFVRLMPGGLVSHYIGKNLSIGDDLEVYGPLGNSYLRAEHTGPILAVAGGSGIAPIKSIIENALITGMRQNIHFYFGVREEKDIYLNDHFQNLARQYPNFKFQLVVDKANQLNGMRAGRVGEAITDDFPTFIGAWNTYLAGPPAMVENLSLELIKRGISDEFIWTDPFITSLDTSADNSS